MIQSNSVTLNYPLRSFIYLTVGFLDSWKANTMSIDFFNVQSKILNFNYILIHFFQINLQIVHILRHVIG